MDVGARIRQIRKSKNLSERELADLTSISQPVINRLENNTRTADIDSIKRICSALGLTLSQFFADKPDSVPELPSEINQAIEKIRKLPPQRLKILNDVLDDWIKGD